MGAPRNFICEGTGQPCGNRKCKKNYCVLDYQEPAVRASPIFSTEQIQKEAEKVARDWFIWGPSSAAPNAGKPRKSNSASSGTG
jgi:hypothetical protein